MHLHDNSFGLTIILYKKASFIAFSSSWNSSGLYFFAFDLNSFLHILHVHTIINGSTINLQFLQNNFPSFK